MRNPGWRKDSERHSLAARHVKTGRKHTIPELRNLEMNEDTYKLRRQVMAEIYEAKKLVPDMPRISVRITESDPKILGMARYDTNEIWITKKAIEEANFDTRGVVFHEILHTVYGINHDESCPLMKPHHKRLPKHVVDERFLYWVNKAKSGEVNRK